MKKRREGIIVTVPLLCLILAVLFGVGSYTASAAMGGTAVFLLVASLILSLVNAIRYCVIINNNSLMSQEKKAAWIILTILFAYIVPIIYKWLCVVKKKNDHSV